MNLNDFVVLPNNKAKSVKLNARKLQDLQTETATLAQKSNEMDEKLQQLKERMSREKEERGHSAGFKWMSGQSGSLNSNAQTNSTTKNKDNRLQKLSAGKLKLRVLKDEPLTAPPQPLPPPPPPPPAVRKSRLTGKSCGQCEVRTAGVMCAECTEDYCISCFTKFHQKGSLKLHRLIPIKTGQQTHVNTKDVVSCLQTNINPNSCPHTSTNPNSSPKSKPNPDKTLKSKSTTVPGEQHSKETEAKPEPRQVEPDSSQEVNHEDERSFTSSLLKGEYNEEESARSFQEALQQWRGDIPGKEEMWTPVSPVSVSATATQTDPASVGGAEGRGRRGGAGRVPVRVEFTKNNLTYMDRLPFKKHRRTSTEIFKPQLASDTYLKSPPDTNTEEEPLSSLTAEEEDFQRYFASLFAVPVSRGGTEPQITAPASCLIIEVLDERHADKGGALVPQHKTDNNRKCPSGEQVLTDVRTEELQTDSTCASSSKSKPSTCPAAPTPRTSKKSIKTPSSMSQKPYCSPTVHKSKPARGSPQLLSSVSLPHCQTEIPKSSHFPVSFATDVSPLASASPLLPEERLSRYPSIPLPLRSTFTLSPTSSTESTLLPRVYQSSQLQDASDSSLPPEQIQSSLLFPKPISSVTLPQSSPSNLQSQWQSQHSLCDPEIVLSHNRLQLSPLTASQSPNQMPSSKSPPGKITPGAYLRRSSTPKHEDAPALMSFTLISGDSESAVPHQDTECVPLYQSVLLDDVHSHPLAVEKEVEDELSTDSGDEMSSDSLDVAPEDSSGDEEPMSRRLVRRRSSEENPMNPLISHPESLVAAVNRSKTDEQEQLSIASKVTQKQGAGSGSQHFCDLLGSPPPSLDINSGHSNTPEHTNRDSVLSSQTSLNDSKHTGSDFSPCSSLPPNTEQHLLIRLMKDNHTQPAAIEIHSTTPTRRGEKSANDRGTSVLVPASQAAREILEICSVDQIGCEDPDLDTDMTAHTLNGLEQELRLMTKGKWNSAFVSGNVGSQHQHKNPLTRGKLSEEQKDEEAAAQRDQQSVLLLP